MKLVVLSPLNNSLSYIYEIYISGRTKLLGALAQSHLHTSFPPPPTKIILDTISALTDAQNGKSDQVHPQSGITSDTTPALLDVLVLS